MAFKQTQVQKLARKLPERFVKTRTERGMTLSYVEGWHVIDEANRVFGVDGWDRETVSAECVHRGAIGGAAPVTLSTAMPLTGKADRAVTMPRRIRDAAHLKYIASLPCLVCGGTPSHAHHLHCAQLRSLGSKPSDEWTVPLCPIHHRSLHDAGREDEWWQAKGIDAKAQAERLWQSTHGWQAASATALQAAMVEGALVSALPEQGPKPPPADGRGGPNPVNLQAGALCDE